MPFSNETRGPGEQAIKPPADEDQDACEIPVLAGGNGGGRIDPVPGPLLTLLSELEVEVAGADPVWVIFDVVLERVRPLVEEVPVPRAIKFVVERIERKGTSLGLATPERVAVPSLEGPNATPVVTSVACDDSDELVRECTGRDVAGREAAATEVGR